MAETAGTGTEKYGQNPNNTGAGVLSNPTRRESDCLQSERLMEEIIEARNYAFPKNFFDELKLASMLDLKLRSV